MLSYEGKKQIFDTNMTPTLTPEKILLDDFDGVGVGVGFRSPVQGTSVGVCEEVRIIFVLHPNSHSHPHLYKQDKFASLI